MEPLSTQDLAAKARFENFKLGGPVAQTSKRHSHSRSHSRNASISLSFSSSTTRSTNSCEMTIPLPLTAPLPSKRNSHHRRRSSVSTRHESAEIMGVSVPDNTQEDAAGEKDFIRRRALWALEGKPDASYSKVEIPELSTPEMEKRLGLDFPTRPSFPPGSGINAFGSGLLSAKRDSFKLLGAASASKDQLHTLLEEEEEEEAVVGTIPPSPPTPNPVSATRARPATLNLRPLSLTPDSLINAIHGLPTPSFTPGTLGSRQGFRPLSLMNDDSTKSDMNTYDSSPSPAPNKRPVLNLLIAQPISVTSGPSSTSSSSSSDDVKSSKPLRRSSISYKCSSTTTAGLPTPEMTPTFSEKRYSSNSSRSSLSSVADYSNDDDVSTSLQLQQHQSRSRESRSGAGALTASEQHFLFKSHNALLSRITDLEKALARQFSSSFGISEASFTPGEPTDEMLRLVADLKAERDELKRDVDGWRSRVGDLEKQIGVFAKRVDNERRDAWVARSKLGLIEVEKSRLVGELEGNSKKVEELLTAVDHLETENAELLVEKRTLTDQNVRLMTQLGDLEVEVDRLRTECERLMFEADGFPTPTPEHGFEPRRRDTVTSLDSASSLTDVESASSDGPRPFGFSLKAVEEESDQSDDDNGLAGYEDEEEADMELLHHSSVGSSSSFGSLRDFNNAGTGTQLDVPQSPITPVTPVGMNPAFQFPMHRPRASLSKAWTFPRGPQTVTLTQSESVDKFFGCLEDGSPTEDHSPIVDYSYERSKVSFASAFKSSSEDDFPAFVLPSHVVGTIVEDEDVFSSPALDVLVEEEEQEEDEEEEEEETAAQSAEEEEDVFGDVGGIKITFTPPQEADEVEVSWYDNQEALVLETPFCQEKEETKTVDHVSQPAMITPPKTIPRVSAIPRATSFKYSSPASPEIAPHYPKLSSPRFGLPSSPSASAFVTPPPKRPSFIPQPITPPSPIRVSTRSTVTSAPSRPSFIRQPQRKPLASYSNIPPAPGSPNSLNCKAQPPAMTNFSPCRFSSEPSPDTANMKEACHESQIFSSPVTQALPNHESYQQYPNLDASSSEPFASSSFASLMPSPIASRLSFQTFTNFIPLSWSPRPKAETSPIATISAGELGASQIQKRGYVSKEAQLEKLKTRLLREQDMTRIASDVCKKCNESEAVHL
ncbi:hypothetical protein C8J56DRAFT_1024565 [Mycena floridula]|nr:hypothetical protein C8J56DRAFT_1024565 [Mycena floridula]